MKKKILLLSFSFLNMFYCMSQITISQADMPNAGDTLRVSYTNDTIDPTLTGPNYTWNYSFLIPNAQWVRKFDSPSNYLFAYAAIFNPINTSYGEEQYAPDSIPMTGLKLSNAYNFFKESSTKYKQVGQGLTINMIPIPFLYNPHDTIYRFPLTYGNADTSIAKFGPAISIGYYYGQTIYRENYVDGWGTLTTPFGTFQTERVKSLVTVRDTFSDSSGTITFAFNRPLQYEYKWLKTGGKIPYLEVLANDVAGNPIVSQIAYRDSMRSGVVQIGINELQTSVFNFQVFPNPSSNYALVEYVLDGSADVRMEIFDMNGKKVSDLFNRKENSGKHIEIINLAQHNLKCGIYFVKMTAGNRTGSEKLVIN